GSYTLRAASRTPDHLQVAVGRLLDGPLRVRLRHLLGRAVDRYHTAGGRRYLFTSRGGVSWFRRPLGHFPARCPPLAPPRTLRARPCSPSNGRGGASPPTSPVDRRRRPPR